MDGRRILVTGGAAGIGAATARLLSQQGARVAVLDTDRSGARAVADEINGVLLVADVRNSAEVAHATREAAEQLGGLDGLFANAGIGMAKPLHTYTDDEWAALVGVNLTGVFHSMRAAIPIMLDGGGGAIVNCSTLAATRPTRGEGPYCAAKAGVIALTKNAALEYAPRIRVNSVSPGFIRTNLTAGITANDEWLASVEANTPMKRIGTAEEVAAVVAFLLSDAASYVTGQDLIIDGGSIMPSLQTDALLRLITAQAGA